MEFGKRLRELRHEHNLTQKALGEKLNVSEVAVRLWETQGREPNYTTLCKIADVLETSTDYLLGRKDY